MTINPNNYPGISVTLVGFASADSGFPAYDKTGSRGISEVRVPIDHGYKNKDTGDWVTTGTTWVTVTGKSDGELGSVRKGDKLRLDDAKWESREFTRKDGSIGQAFQTSFGTVTVLESKNSGSAPVSDDTPF